MNRISTLSRITRQRVVHTAQRSHATTVDQALQHQQITREDIREIYHSPLLDLVFRAAAVHRQHHDPSKIQLCTLMNIKCESEAISVVSFWLTCVVVSAGGCTEDCKENSIGGNPHDFETLLHG